MCPVLQAMTSPASHTCFLFYFLLLIFFFAKHTPTRMQPHGVFFFESCLAFLQLTGKGFPRFLEPFSLAVWNATLGFCRDVSSQAHALFCCFSESFGSSVRWVGSSSNLGPCLFLFMVNVLLKNYWLRVPGAHARKQKFAGPSTCKFGCSCASAFYGRKLILI